MTSGSSRTSSAACATPACCRKAGIGVDAAGIGDIVDELLAREFDEKHIVAISQGWRLNGAIKTTERKVAGGEFVHGDSPLMAWCVGNARIEQQRQRDQHHEAGQRQGKDRPADGAFDAGVADGTQPGCGGRSFWETA
jgi:phage terminase large subunit-like protein